MSLTLKQVEAFDAVLATGSVTRAARMIGVSQPAISRIVADMETAVGFPLFIRSSRTLVPTVRARTLHFEVQRTFLGLSHIEATAAALRERGEGQLRLVLVPSLAPVVSERLVARFVDQHPAASVSVEIVAALASLDWAGARNADVGVTTEELIGPGAKGETIGRTEAVCVMAAGHPLAASRTKVHARDLEGRLFVSYKPDSAFRAEVDQLFASEGLSRDLRVEARTTAAVCELAATLGGVAIIPSPGPQLAADRRLAIRPFRPQLRSRVWLVRPSGLAPSPLASSFIELARRTRLDFGAFMRRSGTGQEGNDS